MLLIRHGQSEFNVVYSVTRVDPGIRDPLLTATGRKAASGGMSAVSEEFNKRLGRLTAAQQKELKNLLEKII